MRLTSRSIFNYSFPSMQVRFWEASVMAPTPALGAAMLSSRIPAEGAHRMGRSCYRHCAAVAPCWPCSSVRCYGQLRGGGGGGGGGKREEGSSHDVSCMALPCRTRYIERGPWLLPVLPVLLIALRRTLFFLWSFLSAGSASPSSCSSSRFDSSSLYYLPNFGNDSLQSR